MTDIVIGILDKNSVTDWIREDWNVHNTYIGNDYLYIAYKDGSIYVEQEKSSWWLDGEKRPSLDISKILYIHWWFAYPNGGGNTQVFINPDLGYQKTMEVLAEFMNTPYTELEVRKNFPYPPETWNIPEKNEYEEV